MRYIGDANLIFSGFISASMTHRFLVDFDNDLLAPIDVYDELEKYQEMAFEKSGLTVTEVEDFIESLFKRIDVVPRTRFLNSL